jgi:hypothetical protein
VHNHGLREYANPQYSHAIKNELETNLHSYKNALADLKSAIENVCVEIEAHKPKLHERYNDLIELTTSSIAKAPQIPISMLKLNKVMIYTKKIVEVCEQYDKAHDACSALHERLLYEHNIIKVTAGGILEADKLITPVHLVPCSSERKRLFSHCFSLNPRILDIIENAGVHQAHFHIHPVSDSFARCLVVGNSKFFVICGIAR